MRPVDRAGDDADGGCANRIDGARELSCPGCGRRRRCRASAGGL